MKHTIILHNEQHRQRALSITGRKIAGGFSDRCIFLVMRPADRSKMLKSPKNYRYITPRCCGTCAFVEYVDETDKKTNKPVECYLRRCRRDHDICQFEAETFYFRVCDYYKQA